ncbi:mpv17-like protein 2 [Pseudoliparis swirei]|uniref:mpv17-like protein 2 n=1 Tax=Pseudoliparis swirei TaxID=2059687 RepID=UPI0024BDDC79|nr:mpv17-like protein 2 [Pseudoliparis swirei]
MPARSSEPGAQTRSQDSPCNPEVMLPRVGSRFLVRMQNLLEPLFQGRNQVVTNTVSAGVLMGIGDIIQQSWKNYQNPDRVQDWMRTGRMVVVGCSCGPLLTYWYVWLDGLFVGNAMRTVGKKVAMDQLFASPFMGMWYFVGLGLLEGNSVSDGWKEFTHKFWDLYKVDCCLWPPAQTINFYFLPPRFRVVYINVITVAWDTYLAHLKHNDDSHIELLSDSCAVDVQLPSAQPVEEKS